MEEQLSATVTGRVPSASSATFLLNPLLSFKSTIITSRPPLSSSPWAHFPTASLNPPTAI